MITPDEKRAMLFYGACAAVPGIAPDIYRTFGATHRAKEIVPTIVDGAVKIAEAIFDKVAEKVPS